MPKANVAFESFTSGLVSPLALARTDIPRIRLGAEQMDNWLPKTIGPMSLRPGLKYLGASRSNLAAAWIGFVARTTDTALLEITDGKLRVWVDDALVTRPSVSTTISNGDFSSSSGWTDNSTGGGDVAYTGSGLRLDAVNRGGVAEVIREITVAGGDQNVEHALSIYVRRGPIIFRCGSTSTNDNYIPETELGTGYHSLTFTPTGNFHLTFRSEVDVRRYVGSVAVEASGVMTVTAPWAAADLSKIRHDQSADVVYVACHGYRQHKIERRNNARSWSVVEYAPDDGPFFPVRSKRVRLKVDQTYGNATMTADRKFFKSTHVGALFRLFHTGQGGTFKLASDADVWTDPIRVSGVKDTGKDADTPHNDRRWTYNINGTWNGTIKVFRSIVAEDEGYQVFPKKAGSNDQTITGNTGTEAVHDGGSSNNVIAWYRMGFSPYTSGAASIAIDYEGGGKTGIVRVIGYNSATSVDVEILVPVSSTKYTKDWREGMWSDYQGFPSSVALDEGRLWWFGPTYMFGSVSDDYENFNQDTEGDAGPIIRSVGTGPVDVMNFALSLNRLIVGTDGAEYGVRSSDFDEPLTPTNTNARSFSTQGSSAAVGAVKVDRRGIFVQRSGRRAYAMGYDVNAQDYQSEDITKLVPELCASGIVSMAVQRQPDTRIHAVLGDGTVAVLLFEPEDEVVCWSVISTDGVIEKAVILPAADEDGVYYHVKRTIDAADVRYLEKLALEEECEGGQFNHQADAYLVYDGASTSVIGGLSHLEGEEVIVWANGEDLSPDDSNGVQTTYTVASGSITLGQSVTKAIVGLPYKARWKSTKLAYAAAAGTALTQRKRVNQLGVILGAAHVNSLHYGPDFDTLDALPRDHEGATVDEDEVFAAYDAPSFEFNGTWDADSRLCLEARAPRPCTILAAVIGIDTSEKI